MTSQSKLPVIMKWIIFPLLLVFLISSVVSRLNYASLEKETNNTIDLLQTLVENRQGLNIILNNLKVGIDVNYDQISISLKRIDQNILQLQNLQQNEVLTPLIDELINKYQQEKLIIEHIKSDMSIIKNSLIYSFGILWNDEIYLDAIPNSTNQLKLLANALNYNALVSNVNWSSEVNLWLEQIDFSITDKAWLDLLKKHVKKVEKTYFLVKQSDRKLSYINLVAHANAILREAINANEKARNTARFFFSGLALMVLLLAIFLAWLGHQMRIINQQLKIEVLERKKNTHALEKLSKVNQVNFQHYLQSILKSLKSAGDADLITVAFFEQPQTKTAAQELNNTLTTQLILSENKVLDNISYSAADSPCEKVLERGAAFYDDKLSKNFPKYALLSKFSVKTYIGYVLENSQGEKLGTLALMYFKQKYLSQSVHSIISAFAANISAEFEKHLLFKKLHEQKELAERTLATMTDGVITVDEQGLIKTLNPAVAKILNLDNRHHYINQSIDEILNIEGIEKISKLIHQCLSDDKAIAMKNQKLTCYKKVKGYDISLVIAPIRNDNHQHVMFFIQDITQEKQYRDRLAYKASHDSLSGLKNRSYTIDKLKEILSVDFKNLMLSVMYIDLDKFKVINDACGHNAGDIALKKAANILVESTRSSDIVARFGGDEFFIVLQDCDLQSSQKVANKILNKFEHLSFVYDNKEFELSASIGLIEIKTNNIDYGDMDYSDLVSIADQACLEAKRQGRNCVVAKKLEETNYEIKNETLWVPRIAAALKNNYFEIYVQPIVHFEQLSTVSDQHFEVLLRLNENGELVYPNEFIPAAERFELMYEIDKWMIENTFKLIGQKQTLQQAKVIAINLSGQSISQSELASFIKNKLKQYKVKPSSICFEVTETSIITNYSVATGMIDELNTLGCQFALDDFGSGLSSYAYLRNIPVKVIKIDKAFANNLTTDKLNQAIVQSIIKLAKKLNITSICEGVETEEVSQMLKEYRVDFQQGYFFSKPFSVKNII